MRWFDKKTTPKLVRTKTWFAFFPVKIGDETRWLETVTVKQEYFYKLGGVEWPTWHNMSFIDNDIKFNSYSNKGKFI